MQSVLRVQQESAPNIEEWYRKQQEGMAWIHCSNCDACSSFQRLLAQYVLQKYRRTTQKINWNTLYFFSLPE
jgi:hypothetical protein